MPLMMMTNRWVGCEDETSTTSSDKEWRGSTGDVTRELGNGRDR